MDYETYLEWKKRRKKKGVELLQNENTLFVTEPNSKKRKRGFTLWG